MPPKSRSLVAALAVLTLAPVLSFGADNSSLLKVLVRKGVLTEKEAINIEAEAQQDSAATKEQSSASKLKLSKSLTELQLYGDVRLRYQYDNKDNQIDPISGLGVATGNSPSGQQRSRWRFRLRLNADFKLGPEWFGGVELQTGYASDSANQTFENGFSDYPIFISRAYVGYHAEEWLTVIAGKQPNPFYTTDLVWDPDINPAGLTERFALHKFFGSSADGTGSLAKDGSVAKDAIPFQSPWEFTLVAGQFIFDDNLEGGGRDPGVRDNDSTTDAYLFETQLLASYSFSKNVKLTIAPAWMIFNGGSVTRSQALTDAFGDFNENSFTDSALVSGATRHLNIIQAPGDLSFRPFGVAAKVFWDFAYNIEGRSRADDIYRIVQQVNSPRDPDDFRNTHRTQDDIAFLVGLQVGENKKKGDLSFLANFRRTGVSSVDPNLNDSDFAQGELNTQGYKLSLAYSLTDFAEFRATWMQAWNLDKNLRLGQATNDNAIADSNAVEVLQVDLNVRF